jgi:hypothetical protein
MKLVYGTVPNMSPVLIVVLAFFFGLPLLGAIIAFLYSVFAHLFVGTRMAVSSDYRKRVLDQD